MTGVKRAPVEREHTTGKDVFSFMAASTESQSQDTHPIFISYRSDDFVGRTTEIEAITDIIEAFRDTAPPKQSMLLFHGVAGMGKSWLMQHCQQEHHFEPPDARQKRRGVVAVYWDFEGESSADVLTDFCTAIQNQIEATLREHEQPSVVSVEAEPQPGRAALRTKASAAHPAAAFFVRTIQTLAKQFTPVLFLDSVGELESRSPETFAHFEEQIIHPLIRRDEALVILSSQREMRGWSQFDIRRRIKLMPLGAFDAETTAEQVPGGDLIYPYSSGYPAATRHIYTHLQQTEDWEESRESGELRLKHIRKIGTALQEIQAWLLEGFAPLLAMQTVKSEAELNQLRRRFPMLATLRYFHIRMLRLFLAASEQDDGLYQLSDAYFQQLIKQLMATQLVRWSPEQHNHQIEPTIRQVINECTFLQDENEFRTRHRHALKIYDEWLERLPENSGRIMIQMLYHMAETRRPARGYTSASPEVVEALQEDIVKLFQRIQPYQFNTDGVNELADEFTEDDELRQLLGDDLTAVVENLIEAFRSEVIQGSGRTRRSTALDTDPRHKG